MYSGFLSRSSSSSIFKALSTQFGHISAGLELSCGYIVIFLFLFMVLFVFVLRFYNFQYNINMHTYIYIQKTY